MKSATLYCIKSNNPLVFPQGAEIFYDVPPKKNQAFLFTRHGLMGGVCNTSTVKKVSRFQAFVVIQTLNSYYILVN